MQVFLVGGAVRDAALGLPTQDRDWVVVGASAQDLIDQGFRPVGRDFPVFLHPQTHEEYALARTERKTAPGYRGFVVHAAPDVTLEQDLARRDLRLNAMAYPAQAVPSAQSTPTAAWFRPERVIDPYGGLDDIRQRQLQHITDAFREDPVRILRLARFAARWPTFGVAPTTLALLRAMVQAGEADHLVSERVWQEFAKGLQEQAPSRLLAVLRDCGALQRLLPDLAADAGAALDRAAAAHTSLPVRYACLQWHMPHASGLRAPAPCLELAELLQREYPALRAACTANAQGLAEILDRCDAWRRPQRLQELLVALQVLGSSEAGAGTAEPASWECLAHAARAAAGVDSAAVARDAVVRGLRGPAVGAALRQARAEAIARAPGPGVAVP